MRNIIQTVSDVSQGAPLQLNHHLEGIGVRFWTMPLPFCIFAYAIHVHKIHLKAYSCVSQKLSSTQWSPPANPFLGLHFRNSCSTYKIISLLNVFECPSVPSHNPFLSCIDLCCISQFSPPSKFNTCHSLISNFPSAATPCLGVSSTRACSLHHYHSLCRKVILHCF